MNKAHEYSPEDWRFAQRIAADLFREKKTPGDCPELAESERGLVNRAYSYPTDQVLLAFAGKMQKEGKNWESVEMPEILRLRIWDLLKHRN